MQSRRALTAAKTDFDTQNSLLLEELPRLYDSRVEYFQPSLQAFASAQVTDQLNSAFVFLSVVNVYSFSLQVANLHC